MWSKDITTREIPNPQTLAPENDKYGCPATYSLLTNISIDNKECWVIDDMKLQEPIQFATCSCTTCQGNFASKDTCTPQMTPMKVMVYCGADTALPRGPISLMRVMVPTTCRCLKNPTSNKMGIF